MSRRSGVHRASTRPLLAATALLLVSGLLSTGPASAHTFTKTDGNDSPSRIDLKAVSVSHTSTGVVHKVQTYNPWTPASLQHDSFFVIQIDKNNDRRYERCAFIFYRSRLRGSLSNCRAQFIRYLPVAKLSGTSARITIPKSETGGVYWWGAASLWDGPRPCARGCVDFAPNNFPDILHDLIPPIVNTTTTPLRVWGSSTTPDFTFPFSVSDAHAGIQSWTIQQQPVGEASWTNLLSGTGAGTKQPTISGVEGTGVDYRVVAVDKHGNRTIGPSRRVYIPTDEDDLDPAAFSDPPVEISDVSAFGGTHTEMSTGTFTYTWTPGTDCLFELIGPGSGDYWVQVTVDGGTTHNVLDDYFPDEPRQTLFSNGDGEGEGICGNEYVVRWVTGTFALDAVLASSD